MPETTPLIKAALNLRAGAGFDVYGALTVDTGAVRSPQGRVGIVKPDKAARGCRTLVRQPRVKRLLNCL